MGICVCICVCVTLLVCNTGVHNPCCTGVCIERFSRGFHSGLVEKCRTALQFTAKYDGKKLTCYYEVKTWLQTVPKQTGWDREEQKRLGLERKALYFWASMHFVELYSDRLSFIFLDSDLLHCLMWHFSFFAPLFLFLGLFYIFYHCFCGVSSPSLLPSSSSFSPSGPLISSYLFPLFLCLSSLLFIPNSTFYSSSSCFEVKGMWLLWWKNKCLLLIGEQPSTIGILGER